MQVFRIVPICAPCVLADEPRIASPAFVCQSVYVSVCKNPQTNEHNLM